MCAQAYIFKCIIWNAERHPKQLRLKQYFLQTHLYLFKNNYSNAIMAKTVETNRGFLKKVCLVYYLSLFKLIFWETLLICHQ